MTVIGLLLSGCARSPALSPRDDPEATIKSPTATSFEKAMAFGAMVDQDRIVPGKLSLDEFASLLHAPATKSDLDESPNEYYFSLCDGESVREGTETLVIEASLPKRLRPLSPRDTCSWIVVAQLDDERRVIKYWLCRSQR